jgi:hypothetical protein
MELIIKEVKSRSELRSFIQFPHSLYKGNPYWVPMPVKDELNTLDQKRNPAFENCEARYWLAYRKGKVVGRIAGIINHTYIKKWGNKYMRFGWFDFIDDATVSSSLLKTIENWAIENHLTGIHGPLGFTDLDPEGMLVEGFKELGTLSTLYNFNYYPTHLEKQGYKKDVDWLEYEINMPSELPAKVKLTSKVVKEKFKLHVLHVRNRKDLLPYAKGIFELLNEAYKNLYGVVPLTEKQIEAYTQMYFSFIQPDYVSVVLQNNKVAAFAITMPSLSKALQKSKGRLFPFGFVHLLCALRKNNTADLYLIAVRPDLQQKGVFSVIVEDIGKSFIKHNISKAIAHPILEENDKMLLVWKDFEKRQIKRRRCFIKQLNPKV